MAAANMTLSILGDSYSTFKGWMPKDYEAWYENGSTSKPSDVTNVERIAKCF